MIRQNAEEIYNLYYQYIFHAKTFITARILKYKQREIDCIIDYIYQYGNSGRILDIGCSMGFITRQLTNHFKSSNVHGADISLSAINRCRRWHPEIQFHHISDGFYERHAHSFDSIILAHVLEHVHDPIELLNKIRGLMTRTGILIVTVPQERIRGDSSPFENIYNLIRLRFENVHRVKYCFSRLSDVLEKAELHINSHRYIHAFKPSINRDSYLNHCLVACVKKNECLI